MMGYNQLGMQPPPGSGGSYGENPEDLSQPQERSPQVSGIEDILMMLKQKLQLPMLPPMPPSLPGGGQY